MVIAMKTVDRRYMRNCQCVISCSGIGCLIVISVTRANAFSRNMRAERGNERLFPPPFPREKQRSECTNVACLLLCSLLSKISWERERA